MKAFIKPQYLYFLLPLTVFFVATAITLNYLLLNDKSSAAICWIKLFAFAALFNIAIPIIIQLIGFGSFLDSQYGFIYFYTWGTIVGIYMIKEQMKYFKLRDYNSER